MLDNDNFDKSLKPPQIQTPDEYSILGVLADGIGISSDSFRQIFPALAELRNYDLNHIIDGLVDRGFPIYTCHHNGEEVYFITENDRTLVQFKRDHFFQHCLDMKSEVS